MFSFIKELFTSKTDKIRQEEERKEQIKLENQKRNLKRMMDTLNIEEEITRKKMYHSQQIEKNFPLERGDLILLENGHEYRICKKEMKGIINESIVKLKLVNDSHARILAEKNLNIKERLQQMEARKLEEIKFNSLEQLNQYWIGKKETIRRITKNNEIAQNEKISTL